MDSELNSLLKGITVIELANALAGPAAGMFFAELGADVIKIENPHTNGDITRRWRNKYEDQNSALSSYYCSANYNKQSLYLDLKSDAGRKTFFDLLEKADILLCNLNPSSAKRMNLDLKELHLRFSRLILVNLIGYGPEQDRSAFDLAIQAESGMMYLNREKDQEAMRFPFPIVDVLAGHQIKEAVLLALFKLEKNGKGSYIEVSLYLSAITGLMNQASYYLNSGVTPKPIGSLHPTISPYGEVFESRDHIKFTLAIGTESQFARLAEILELDKELVHNQYRTNVLRVNNRISLFGYLSSQIKMLNWKVLENSFLQHDIPFGRIKEMNEVFEEQMAAKMIRNWEDEVHRSVSSIAFSLRG
jgi:crotonobetainyl-CoA:carnitine CoA-transferase CaiB-like acyl-CoA transferase